MEIKTKITIEYTTLGILVIAIIWFSYVSFFKPNDQTPPIDLTTAGNIGSFPVNPNTSDPSYQLLPNGSGINTAILNDPRFKALVPPVYPRVTPQEVGQANPFK